MYVVFSHNVPLYPMYRLLYLLQQETSSTELKTECAVVLGSLAMGTENNVKSLLDCHIIPALLQGIFIFMTVLASYLHNL